MIALKSRIFSIYMGLSALLIAIFAFWSLFRKDWAMKVGKFWNATALFGLKHICGIDSEIIGKENLPDGPAIIASKHQTMWETMALCSYLPFPSFVLKKELGRIPIFGWWCAQSGFIFIDRSAGAKALRKMVEDSKAAIASDTTHIIIFPEGTRSPIGTKAPYQPGLAALAKALSLPIVPVAVNSGVFWQHPSGRKVPGKITLEFLPPLSPDMPRAQLMPAVEEVIETATRRLEAEGLAQIKDEALRPSQQDMSHGTAT